ncbi:Detected protein of confused Function [Hibiscus syriacus]|uniref:Detected protein of confused Function n=1 Tax=Hibiscus syriacus TaxID=106335 RepID=A0A6A3CXN1_HIBSY|nr:Detected protein of confused Function [Hibiscus syriacus]
MIDFSSAFVAAPPKKMKAIKQGCLVDDVSAFGADWANNRFCFRSKFRNHFLDMEGDGGFAPNSTFGNFFDAAAAAMDFDFMDELLFEGCWLETSDGFNFMQPGPSISSGPDPNDPSQSLHQGEVETMVPDHSGSFVVQGTELGNRWWIGPRAESDSLLSMKERLMQAIGYLKESTKDTDVLIQIWVPLPELTPDVRFFRSDEYPRISFVQKYNVGGSLALSVFEPGGGDGTCWGVVEVVTTTQKINYHPKLECVCKALETCNELYQAALPDIVEVLRSICKRYKLPLALTWAPCLNQGKSGCGHSDENFYRCVSTLDSACFVADEGLSGFLEACSEHHLFRGQGIVGRAFTTNKQCFATDITAFSKTNYPLTQQGCSDCVLL